MSFFAHAIIETDDARYQRGDAVPESVEGFDELLDSGAVSEDPYDPADEPTQVPDIVEIDGVQYVRASDGAKESGNADA